LLLAHLDSPGQRAVKRVCVCVCVCVSVCMAARIGQKSLRLKKLSRLFQKPSDIAQWKAIFVLRHSYIY